MLTIPTAHAPFRHRFVVGSHAWTETVKSSYAGLIDFEDPAKNPEGPELTRKLEDAYLRSHPLPEIPEMPEFSFSSVSQWEEELEDHLNRRESILARYRAAVTRIQAGAVEYARQGATVVNWLRGRR